MLYDKMSRMKPAIPRWFILRLVTLLHSSFRELDEGKLFNFAREALVVFIKFLRKTIITYSRLKLWPRLHYEPVL